MSATALYFFFFAAAPPAGPTLSVSASSLTFTTPVGINPPSQTFTITNAGTGSMPWTLVATGSGLGAVPTAGTAPSIVTVSVNVSGLLAGIYPGSITVTAPGATGSPVVIPVTLVVEAVAATLGVTPLVLNFAAQQGTNPAPQTVTVLNLGPGTFTWTATPIGANVTAVPSTGSPPGTFQVNIDTTGLVAGSYQRQIIVSTVP